MLVRLQRPLQGALICLAGWLFFTPAHAEIYKWVDENGRVHFSDKKHAADNAQPLYAEQLNSDPNVVVITAEADAMIGEHWLRPRGSLNILSAGQWQVGNRRQKNNSLLRFDFADLISRLRANPNLSIRRAELLLFANTEENVYNSDGKNSEPPGHSNLAGDNAFYLKAVHNNWQESDILWKTFYNSDNYTPASVRNVPVLSVPGSGKDNTKDFVIDFQPIIHYVDQTNLRTLSLEMSLQRSSRMAQVSFYSHESPLEKRPRIEVELFDAAGEATQP